jgi:hypothetical protein
MCGASRPPDPKAPPAPVPQRDTNMDGLRSRQQAAAASQSGGYESTILSSGGPTASTASPTLGR